MRVLIQGGVWKNTEDEILKAAVMKYGKNQWSRISSLLVRKSAKQCKARWYEWLDPSIKKTEWTREEDEKLLHLAKLMPCQWRTLAPIVGRTPAQCLERYEKLLDAASAKAGQYDHSDDPRRLRPGEIDPNPESKPARPDPVDMDEDEKEMLSEARARLANTKGKKAKRKAREKQLEAARRLASLQKRREMRAAGLAAFKRYTKRKHIDYAAEIPFQQTPAAGFYDTSGENPTPDNREFIGKTIEQIEGKRRMDVEAQKRKEDSQKSKMLKRHNLPLALEQTEKLNDPEQIRKRSRLSLPAPQVSDQELAEIAKMGTNAMDITDHGSAATQSLLSSYDQTPSAALRTPMRTPSTSVDNVMAEAENLVKLQNMQTPLLGGDNPDLHSSDFSGITPKRNVVQTPNPLMTPARTPGGTSIEGSATPMSVRGGAAASSTPLRTPLRDELNINNEDSWMSEGNERLEKQRSKVLKRGINDGLSRLPAPKNEYQIMVPELEEERPSEDVIEEDMEDVLKRRKEIEDAKLAAEMRKRSQSVQRDLPRPLSTKGVELKPRAYGDSRTLRAERLIMDEMMQLLEHDCAKYPVKERKDDDKGKKQSKKRIPQIQSFEETDILQASNMVKEEVEKAGPPKFSAVEFEAASENFGKSMIYLQSHQGYGLSEGSSMSDRLNYYQKTFDALKEALDKDKKRTTKLEAKLEVLTSGYMGRSQKMQKELEQTYDSVVSKVREQQSFEELEEMEKDAIHFRLDALRRLAHEQEEHEKTLQEKYSMLENRRNELRATATS